MVKNLANIALELHNLAAIKYPPFEGKKKKEQLG